MYFCAKRSGHPVVNMVHPVLQYKNITENRTGKFSKKKNVVRFKC